jgi:hypothetical protein
MQGNQLSHDFFRDVVLPILKDRFAGNVGSLSAAMVGDGSDILGYDDAISQDHNFAPRVALFLADDAYDEIGKEMAEELRQALPEHYMDVLLLWTEYVTSVQVFPLRRYFQQYLGVRSIPCATMDWLRCDEQKLLNVTVGRVFHDPSGQLAALRNELGYYPQGVRLYLLHVCFARMSETAGVERCIRRGDWIAAHHYMSYFTYFAIRAAHLLAKRFCPYHKWMARSLQELGMEGVALHARIQDMVRATSLPDIREAMLMVLYELGSRTMSEVGLPPPKTGPSDGFVLLGFDWDTILGALSRKMPKELRDMSPVISPPSYLGPIFDYTGHGATYKQLLESNLRFQKR